MCRIAITTRSTPSAVLTASDASEGAVLGLGGLLPVATTAIVTTMARDTSHPKGEGRAFAHAALGRQHDQECRQRQRVERYRQADQDQVKDLHGCLFRLHEIPAGPAAHHSHG
jgi:hypothetical protein